METGIELVERLDFETPPLREVTLSLFFAPVLNIISSAVIPILQSWSDEYPVLEEEPPATPWSVTGRGELTDGIVANSHWPIPLFSASAEDRSRTIRIQEDRFELIWRFDPDSGGRYVGYKSLKSELEARFEHYVRGLKDTTNITSIEVERVDATYQNVFDLAPVRYLTGLLTNWAAPVTRDDLAGDYIGMRLGNLIDPSVEEVSTLVSIDPIFDQQATSVEIDVQCEAQNDKYLEVLDLAHRVVLTSFARVTSDSMRQGWGEKT